MQNKKDDRIIKRYIMQNKDSKTIQEIELELLDYKKRVIEQEKIINVFNKQRMVDSVEFSNLFNEYRKLLSSKTWKYTKFIRSILDKIKSLKKNKNINIDINEIRRNKIYNNWINIVENNIDKYESLNEPLLTIIISANDEEIGILKNAIDSMINQIYTNWQLIILNNNRKIEVNKYIYGLEDNKIKITDISNFSVNDILGEYFGYLDCCDVLSPNALQEVALACALNKGTKLLYSDHDVLLEDDKTKNNPFFKPDYSPDTLLSFNYLSPFVMFKKTLLNENDNIKNNLSKDYGFILSKIDNLVRNDVYHIDKVLYHLSTKQKTDSSINAINHTAVYLPNQELVDTIKRRNIKGYVGSYRGINNVIFDDLNTGVSVIIPSKDNYNMLKKCVDSIINITEHSNYEIIVVDNGSNYENRKLISEYLKNRRINYIYNEMPFNFSRLCNMGVNYSTKPILAFVNDDIEIKDPKWMSIMTGQAIQSYTGAVGAKLYYPNTNIIQHCGVGCYLGGPGHYLQGVEDNVDHYYCRNLANYNVLAVTAACLFVERKKFDEVSGFNEILGVNYNDVDLCMKLYDVGYYNVVRNDVVCIHHESISRGPASVIEIYKAKELLTELNPNYKDHDPFYNRNLPQFSSNFDYERDLSMYNI